MASDLISREAAIAEIEEYIEEYSELDENGYHNLKWCAMEEAKDTLLMLPAVDAIPVEWLREWQDEVGTLNEWWPIIERIITVWREEQEAQDG